MKVNWSTGNKIDILEYGEAFFPALLDSIEAAQKEILFETYIYSEDEIGKKIAEALLGATSRGVDVSLVLDGFGSAELSKNFIDRLRLGGIKVVFFRPKGNIFSLKQNYLHRLHRKVVVVDETVAFVGGMNISDDQLKSHPGKSRYDLATRVEGPAVDYIHQVLDLFRARLARKWIEYLKIKTERPPKPSLEMGRAAFVIRDNFKFRRRIERLYLEGINTAKSEVIIANAYFYPGVRFQNSLLRAARRGVEVKIIVQGKIEYFIVYLATLSLYHRLLKAGVRIYEYTPRLLHAKAAVIDSEWMTVGSCNLDPFSFFLNLEANLLVEDVPLANDLRSRLLNIIESDCRPVDPKTYLQTDLFTRILIRISFLFLRYLPRWVKILSPKVRTDEF